MKRSILCFSLTLVLFGMVGSCSDLKNGKVTTRGIQSRQLSAGCKLDVGQFEFILERDISFQIDCMNRNLELFMRVVESGRPGHLNRAAFEAYAKKDPDFNPQNIKAIKAIFDISYLIFGGDPEYISPQSVRRIVDFVYLFNREAVRMYPLFSSTDDNVSLNLHRLFSERVHNGTLTIADSLLRMSEDAQGGEPRALNIIDLLDAFSTADQDTILDKVKAALFVKRLFIGGERQVITHLELRDLLTKFVPLSPVAYDIVRLKYLDLNQKSQLEMILNDIQILEKNLYYAVDSNEKLFSTQELAEALASFTEKKCKPAHTGPDGTVVLGEELPDGTRCPDSGIYYSLPDLRKYPEQLVELKMMLMTTEPFEATPNTRPEDPWTLNPNLAGREWVRPAELKLLFDRAKDLANRGAVYHRLYEFYKTHLDSPASVSLNVANMMTQFPSIPEKYIREFARIVQSYRFFRGTFESPYFASAIRRNGEGIVEIGIYESLLTTIFRRYGASTRAPGAPAPRPQDPDYCPGDQVLCLGGYGSSQDQLLNVFKVYKKLLVEEDMITDGLEPRTNQNLTLLSTLFQYQSNGDGTIHVNEMSELVNTVLTSFNHADYFYTEMKRLCKPLDARKRITDLNCYRREFFGVACRKYQQYYPKLFESFGMTTCPTAETDKERWLTDNFAEVERYLKTLEVVARTCTVFNDGTDVPMDDGDFMPIWVMMMNIEGTVARYDVNGNNKMDPSEVRTAYRVAFHPAVEALVEDQAAVIAKLPFNLGSAISKKIYYYLIKYGAVPKSVKQYLKLIFIGASPANRQTIASVLKVIGEESPATVEFDCETLRH